MDTPIAAQVPSSNSTQGEAQGRRGQFNVPGLQLVTEGNNLLAQAQGLKPGWQTTEFYFHCAVVIAIIALIGFGRVDGSFGSFLLAADAIAYQAIRKGLKLDCINAALQHFSSLPLPAQLALFKPLMAVAAQAAPLAEAIAQQEISSPAPTIITPVS